MVLIQQMRYQEATPVMDSITDYIETVSPGVDIYNYRVYYGGQDELPDLTAWLNDQRTKTWFNVPPSVSYTFCNDGVYANFSYDMSTSVADLVAQLTGNVKIMIYSGADDIIVNTAGTNNWIANNYYPWKDDIRRAQKTIWTKNGEVLGTMAATNSYWQVVVNKAGHMVPGDQGVSGLDMLQHFINGDKLWQN
jgi:carboxypeptidase C (cathepsin A)